MGNRNLLWLLDETSKPKFIHAWLDSPYNNNNSTTTTCNSTLKSVFKCNWREVAFFKFAFNKFQKSEQKQFLLNTGLPRKRCFGKSTDFLGKNFWSVKKCIYKLFCMATTLMTPY